MMEDDPYELAEKVRDRMDDMGVDDLTEKQYCILYIGTLHGDGRVLVPGQLYQMIGMANSTSLKVPLNALCRQGYLCKRMSKYVVTESGMRATGGRSRWDWEFYHWIEDNYMRLPKGEAHREVNPRVYYLHAPMVNLCKIGVTSQRNLSSRVCNIRTASPIDIVLLAVEHGGKKLEGERHRQFSDLRVKGEWFKFEGPLCDHVLQVAGNAANSLPQT